jgi:putative Holliday junction resolvase
MAHGRSGEPGASERPLAIEALAARLPVKARLIGVDLGTKTIGLALSDVERRIATPLLTLSRKSFGRDAELLVAEVRKFDAFALIFGLPVDMEGREGPRAQATRAFARNFSERFPIPIAFWDERFSTAAVTRALIATDVSRARRAEVVDKMAAAYILQGALDRLSRMSPPTVTIDVTR